MALCRYEMPGSFRKHLPEERIEDVRPQIPLGEELWSLSKKRRMPSRGFCHRTGAKADLTIGARPISLGTTKEQGSHELAVVCVYNPQ